jgi:mono/diheme cytochrome c family protein
VPPLYIQLGLNIDEPPGTPAHLPLHKPSAARGELLGVAPPAHYQAPDYLRAHSPAQVWQALRAEPATGSLDAEQVWDLVAFTLQSQTGPLAAALSRGDPPAQMEFGHRTVRPVAFTDSAHMLALSPARLQGKIIRGGMGTGMPYWGPIFTEAQTWALVDFLWSFQFQYKEMP